MGVFLFVGWFWFFCFVFFLVVGSQLLPGFHADLGRKCQSAFIIISRMCQSAFMKAEYVSLLS